MANSKRTKRALLLSLLSIMLCFSTLVGSTFAWFTDNATTGLNSIVAGTLDIELVDGNGDSLAGKTIGFVKANENTKWEPGSRFTLEEIKLVNNGNLSAKYKVDISAVIGDVDLSKVIDVYEDKVKLGTLDSFLNKTIKEGVILPNETLSFKTLTLVMQTTAGNEYQGKAISDIAITVFATQASVEEDSFDNSYDNNAQYNKEDEYKSAGYDVQKVENNTQLIDTLKDATASEPIAILLSGDAESYAYPTDVNMIDKDIVFTSNEGKTFDMTAVNVNGQQNLTGADFTFDGVHVKFQGNSWYSNGYTGFGNLNKLTFKNCTISGAQYLYAKTVEFINCTFENNADSYSVCTYSAKDVTFTNCTFNTAGKAVLLYRDSAANTNVTLVNCVFNSDDTIATDKAAVETGDDGSQQSVFNITFENCTQEGFDANNSTSPLWGNKESSNMPSGRLNVVIDGEKVY